MKITLKKEPWPKDFGDTRVVTIEAEVESLGYMLSALEDFIRASGFVLGEGKLMIGEG